MAAYVRGMGLAAIAVIGAPDDARIIALAPGDDGASSTAANVHVRWWCKHAADAARVAAAAARTPRRKSDPADAAPSAVNAAPNGGGDGAAFERAAAAVASAAKRLHIMLRSETDIAAEAMNVAARVDVQIQSLQQSGGLKSVNRTYRNYRLETSARGERALRYDQWMRNYRNTLVREVAATLRLI